MGGSRLSEDTIGACGECTRGSCQCTNVRTLEVEGSEVMMTASYLLHSIKMQSADHITDSMYGTRRVCSTATPSRSPAQQALEAHLTCARDYLLKAAKETAGVIEGSSRQDFGLHNPGKSLRRCCRYKSNYLPSAPSMIVVLT